MQRIHKRQFAGVGLQLLAAWVVTLPVLGNSIANAPTAWADCSPTAFKLEYVRIWQQHGVTPSAAELAADEAQYLKLLAQQGMGGRDTCLSAQSAYSILVPISRGQLDLNGMANAIMKETGVSRATADFMMNSAFNAFGFPPTCDLSPNRTC